MINGHSGLREFGKFRLDVGRKLLWLGPDPVPLPLKAVDLLCVLVERRGEVVSKNEIWHEVWNDAFIEETNLTHNIYTLRKTFKDLGEPDLIKTVPRRGYRFTGIVHEIPDGEIVLERHALTRTSIEIQDDVPTETLGHLHELGARKTSLQLVSLHLFKIAVACGVIALVVGGFSLWQFERTSANVSRVEIRSIAVLPLKSFASRNDDDELRLRITDALITRLGGNNELAVRPTSAIMQFVNDETDPRELGGKLLVDAVVDGRIQHEGDRVRVTIQMLSVTDGKQIWSEQFDGRDDQILNLQDAISTKVMASLDARRSQPLLGKPPTDNSDAYEAYLKGRYFWRKRDAESLRKSIGFFQQAAALDPQFAEAYSGIADAQILLYDSNADVTPSIVSEAKETLHHALLLKPDSAEALTTLGGIQMSYDWDWQGAERSLGRSTELAPNSPFSWLRYGALLLRIGRFDEAQHSFEKAIELDPLSLLANTNLAMVLFCKKDFPASDAQVRKTLEINGNFGMAHWLLSRSLWLQGRKAESAAEIVRSLESEGKTEWAAKFKDKVESGSPEDGIALLLDEWRNDPEGTNPHNMAYMSTYVGDNEKAIYWLQRSFKEHHPWTTWIAAAPEFDVLRDDTRFKDLINGIGLAGQ